VFEIEAQLQEWDQLKEQDENPSGGAVRGAESR
jgi:hypothetical protein